MIWPPLKAWTSKSSVHGQVYFVAINYGGEFLDRWVVLMSVLDSSVVVKVSWSKLIDPSSWKCGWDENNYSNSSKLINKAQPNLIPTFNVALANKSPIGVDTKEDYLAIKKIMKYK